MRSRVVYGAGVVVSALCEAAALAQPFASRVVEYRPAPGQNVNNPAYNNPARALGAPVGGGTVAADNTKVVTLGGFGGSITLGFDQPVPNQPVSGRNPRGLDFIVYGNAFWSGGNANRRFAEPATVEVSADVNLNGLADDPWYLLPGSHLTPPLPPTTATWDDNIEDPTYPPADGEWAPPGESGSWTTSAFQLPAAIFASAPIIVNPNGPSASVEGLWGYADCSPTLILGDTLADNQVHDPSMAPAAFYTRPDDPLTVGVTPGSGGGDAMDVSWAINPATGGPAGLNGFDFVRITTAANLVHPLLGELSTEIGAVARVILPARSDWDGDGAIAPADVAAFVNAWLGDLLNQTTVADFDGDGATLPADVAAFVGAWFAGE